METNKYYLDIQEIKKIIPQRYPFLMVDRVIEFVPNKTIRAYKNVSINEPFFQGHFPDEPIMPGVLICEALAQAGIIFAKKTDESLMDKLIVFAGLDKVRFRHPVYPGDQLILELELIKQKRNLWKMKGVAKVLDTICVEAILMASVLG